MYHKGTIFSVAVSPGRDPAGFRLPVTSGGRNIRPYGLRPAYQCDDGPCRRKAPAARGKSRPTPPIELRMEPGRPQAAAAAPPALRSQPGHCWTRRRAALKRARLSSPGGGPQ